MSGQLIIYLCIMLNGSLAHGISTMTGHAPLDDTQTHWRPSFRDGNTVVISKNHVILTMGTSKIIGAIRLDETLAFFGSIASITHVLSFTLKSKILDVMIPLTL